MCPRRESPAYFLGVGTGASLDVASFPALWKIARAGATQIGGGALPSVHRRGAERVEVGVLQLKLQADDFALERVERTAAPFHFVCDAPDHNLSCPARERSTTAPQSLTLLNADEVTAAAKFTEARLMKEAGSNDERITLAYRLVLGRPPTAKEHALARAFLAQSPLNEFCRALFNLNDFVYAE